MIAIVSSSQTLAKKFENNLIQLENVQMESSCDKSKAPRLDLHDADSHGHAALQLTESLMHSLIDNSVINLAEARNVVSIAIDATDELADDSSTRPETLDRSIALLTNIRHSLREEE